MHFEVPRIRMHSLRDFAQHYFMIVLSILTALGLEQWIEHTHHRHAAELASEQIETELRGTLDSIHGALDNNTNQSATWIDIDRLHRYATAYAAQRDASNWVTHDSTIALNGPRMVDLRTRINLGKDVDPVEFLGILQQMINTSTETSGHLEQTAKPIEAALAAHAR